MRVLTRSRVATLAILALGILGSVAAPVGAQSPVTVGIISRFAGGGTGTIVDGGSADAGPMDGLGLTLDPSGNMYVSEGTYIWRINAGSHTTTLIAGTGVWGFGGDGGPATAARINGAWGMALDSAGNLYFADRHNHRVRKVAASTGIITTIAGTGTPGTDGYGGPATLAQLDSPRAVAVDATGNVFIQNQIHGIVKVDANTHLLTGVARGGGFMAFDGSGNLISADGIRINRIDVTTGQVTRLAGLEYGRLGGVSDPMIATDVATDTPLEETDQVAVDAHGDIYFSDAIGVHKLTVATGRLTMIAGSSRGNEYQPSAGVGGLATAAMLGQIYGLAVDAAGTVYIGCYEGIMKVDTQTPSPVMSTVAGTGKSEGGPNDLDMADFLIRRIRQIDAATGIIRTVAGNGSLFRLGGDGWPSTVAPLVGPTSCAVDAHGSLYIADDRSHYIRKSIMSTAPPTFSKVAPPAPQATSATLGWGASSDATGYEYCVKTTSDSACGAWVSTGTATRVVLRGLSPATSYHWQVRAHHYGGTITYADGAVNAFASFTSAPLRQIGDFDGDRKAELTIYRPTTGGWYVLNSSTNMQTYNTYGWGLPGDQPEQGDFDGDGTPDLAVYRPTTGQWWILWSNTKFQTYGVFGWGLGGDVPVAADYDGDGKTDIAIYRPTTAGWWILKSSTGFATYSVHDWGLGGDIPLPQRP